MLLSSRARSLSRLASAVWPAARTGGAAAVLLALLALLTLLVRAAGAAEPAELRHVGYTQLREALGDDVPTGRGVRVTLVDTGIVDRTNANFRDKNLIFGPGVTADTGISGHATGCGAILFGANRSMARGIANAELWVSQVWMAAVMRGANEEAVLAAVAQGGARVGSHSYIAQITSAAPLVGLDMLIDRYDYLQVVGIPNGGSTLHDLWGSAFNAITCGKTNGTHPPGTTNLGAVYTAGRTKPDIVGPMGVTSNTTPLTGAAAALLIGMSQDNPRLSSGSYMSRSGRRIYHAGTAETVKAVLMAGADRRTANEGHANITDWGVGEHRAPNGLDRRFGAGQLNVFQAHRILAAGEQEPGDDDRARAGWDFNGEFRAGQTPTYFLRANDHDQLQAVLVWNLDTRGEEPVLRDLDLVLWDATAADPAEWHEVARSACTINNTESVAMTGMQRDRRYALQVVAKDAEADFTWRYALAWRTDEGETPDTEAPTVEVHAPEWGNWVTGPATIRATAEDNRPGVRVQFTVNGEPAGEVLSSAPFTLELNPADYHGQRVLRIGAVATDAAGNEAQAEELRLDVVDDRQAPRLTVRDRSRGNTYTLTIRARDRYGVRRLVIHLLRPGSDEPEEVARVEFVDGRDDAEHEYVFDTTGLAGGQYEFRVIATDLAGNEETAVARHRQR